MTVTELSKISDSDTLDILKHKVSSANNFNRLKTYFHVLGGSLSNATVEAFHEKGKPNGPKKVVFTDSTKSDDTIKLTCSVYTPESLGEEVVDFKLEIIPQSNY